MGWGKFRTGWDYGRPHRWGIDGAKLFKRMAESYPGLMTGLYDCGMGKAENQLGLWKATKLLG